MDIVIIIMDVDIINNVLIISVSQSNLTIIIIIIDRLIKEEEMKIMIDIKEDINNNNIKTNINIKIIDTHHIHQIQTMQ